MARREQLRTPMPRSVRDSMRKRWAQRLRERREALRHRLRQGCSARDIATAAAREWSHGWMSGGTANPLGASSGCAPGGGMDEEVAGDGPAPRCSGATGLDAGREWRDKQNLFNDDVDDLIGYMEHLIESGLLDEGLPAQLEQVINEDAAEVDALAEEFDSLGSDGVPCPACQRHVLVQRGPAAVACTTCPFAVHGGPAGSRLCVDAVRLALERSFSAHAALCPGPLRAAAAPVLAASASALLCERCGRTEPVCYLPGAHSAPAR